MKYQVASLGGIGKIAVLAMSALLLRMALADSAKGFETRGFETGVFETTELAPGNHVHYGSIAERTAANRGDIANIGFIVGDDCVLAVDAGGSLAVGQALRQAIRRVTDKPVCYVILTHVHPDHFFGAAAFLPDRPQFVAHENYPQQLAARARPYINALRRDLGDAADGSEIVKPTLLVGDRVEFDLGGRKVTVQAWPLAHTDDDLTVYDNLTRTLWLADLLFVGHTPVIDGSITGFLGVIDRLRTIDAEHHVPGHGRSEAAWPAVMDAQQRYFEVILKETREAIRAKRTIQQATDEVGLSEEKNWAMFDLYHRRNVTTAYAELEWE
jgi:quinoprotein relay system zinc metallohydrolase 2